jgi:hypothetical protein
MQKFKKGDKVKIRYESPSPYRGRIGVVDAEPSQDSRGFWYQVKNEIKGLRAASRFAEKDLEAITG